MSGAELLEVVDRTLPIVVFLLTITVVAAAADAAGVFDVAGHTAARVAGLRVVLLWLLLAGLAIVVTAVGALASNLVNNLPAPHGAGVGG